MRLVELAAAKNEIGLGALRMGVCVGLIQNLTRGQEGRDWLYGWL